MKRLLLVLMLLASVAQAKMVTVTNDSQLSSFNGNAVANDTALVLPGSYTVSINPAHSGLSWRSRISYIGGSNLYDNPFTGDKTSIPGNDITKDYIRVKRFKFTGSNTFAIVSNVTTPVIGTWAHYCILEATNISHAERCGYYRCTINRHLAINATAQGRCYRDSLVECNGTLHSDKDNQGTRAIEFYHTGSNMVEEIALLRNNFILNTTKISSCTQAVNQAGALWFNYGVINSLWQDNTFTCADITGCPVTGSQVVFELRNGCIHNTFINNKWNIDSANWMFYYSAAGNGNPNYPNEWISNSWTSGSHTTGAFIAQQGISGRLYKCTWKIVGGGTPPFDIQTEVPGELIIDKCSIKGTSNTNGFKFHATGSGRVVITSLSVGG